MSVTPSSHVVGMFTERAAADDAVEALHTAGFEDERISYSTPGASGGFFEDLKSLFTGTNPGTENLVNNLTHIGLSNEQAQYYADEYNNGNTILVVNAPGREEQVLGILHQYGAYNAHSTGVRFGGASAASAATDSVSPAADATPASEYASVQAEPASYTSTASDAEIQNRVPDADTQSQYQYQTANDQPLASQPGETATPVTPLHDVEDQPTQPVTSEYATEPHHATDEVTTHEYNVENGTGPSDVHTPEHDMVATSAAPSSLDAPASQVEDQPAQSATATSDYGTTEGETTHPAVAAADYQAAGEHATQPAATTSEYVTTEDEVAQPTSTASDYETAGEHAAQPAATSSEYATAGDQEVHPAATTSEYGTTEGEVTHPAATTSEYETAEEPAVHSAATTTDYGTVGDQAGYASATTLEDRAENQMAEPASVAPEHEIEPPHAEATEQTTSDQVVSPTADAHTTTEEPLLSQQGVAEPEPAIVEQTGQPDAVLSTHDVAQQQALHDSTLSSEPDAITQEQPILNSTVPPTDGGTLDNTVTPDSTAATTQPETVATPPAQTSAPAVDYASKLQALQQQLQSSQQQLQEVKARLQAAKDHETQIQSTREQLKAIQDELAATQAELNETHSRIDQY